MTLFTTKSHRLLNTAKQCIATGLLVWAAMGTAQAELAPLQTVPSVDVPRYMGTWHEIAKYPNWFQKKCASSTQATYTLQANGPVSYTHLTLPTICSV